MKNPLQEIFHFTRSERNGIVVLVFIIALLIIALALPNRFYRFNSEIGVNKEKRDSLLAEYRANLVEAKSKYREQKNDEERSWSEPNDVPVADRKPVKEEQKRFQFDPNSLSADSFELLGFKDYVAENIIKYRNHGGRFSEPKDLKDIYYIDTILVDELAGLMEIKKRKKRIDSSGSDRENDTLLAKVETDSLKRDSTRENKYKDISFELNTCNAEELQEIYGIGPAYSGRIINYRDLLGGYLSVGQLKEVYGINDSLYSQIAPYFTVTNRDSIKKININEADAYEIGKHPYITNYLAIQIETYRRENGKFENLEDLREHRLLNDVLYIKIAPYLKVTKN
ncbi:helix-hairpin-helix domain-containing protein [Salibacter halophilus]|uniref:Helix-hairpin-helix domain-containing protein n=1 Tax=Salibacter halophilus TaxID=1803916 RepID=A0A6N6M1P4_9FLAO|nr:helix-hairpin-helix domain-containing protein [Salibacter halophilus]KAB1062705.1 helix-hairpin-helix domain-containing protein [Salibacter halophilus]